MQRQRRLFKQRAVEESGGILQSLHRLIHDVINLIPRLTRGLALLYIQRKRHFKFVIALAAQRPAKARDAGLAGVALARQFSDRQVEHPGRIAEDKLTEFLLRWAVPGSLLAELQQQIFMVRHATSLMCFAASSVAERRGKMPVILKKYDRLPGF